MDRIRTVSVSSRRQPELDLPTPTTGESPSWLLSELLQNFSPSHTDDSSQYTIDNSNKLIDLLLHYPEIKQDLSLQTIINTINFMFYSKSGPVKAASYKILRYCIANEDSLYVLVQNRLLILMIITLSTDSSSEIEKLNAVRLVHRFLTIESGSNYLSIGIVKLLMHLLDDDLFIISVDLQHVIMETLLEIALLNPQLLYHADGFNLLIRYLTSNGDIALLINCLFIILKLLETTEFQHFFRNGYNINSLISVFDEESLIQPLKLKIQKFQKVLFLLTVFLKNWNGLMCCSLNSFQVLRDLLESLDGDDTKLKEFIVDILLDVLRIKPLPWLRTSVVGEFLLQFNPNASFVYKCDQDAMSLHYINHYIGLVTFVLIRLGLVDLLLKNIDSPINDKVVLLLSHLYKHSKTLLPPEFGLELSDQALLHALIKISDFSMNSHRKPVDGLEISPDLSGAKIDDSEFKSLVNNSRILTVKEFNSWDWKLILDIFQGPLQSERKFLEIMEKQPKFFKRLLSFYRPFKFRFCNLSNKSKDLKRILTVGVLIFETLMKYPAGVKYLYKNKIMIQILEIYAQVDPLSGIRAKVPILAEKNLISTLNFGYLKFVGKLTESDNGMKLLHQWQFFQLIDNIIESSESSKSNNVFLLTLFKNMKFGRSELDNFLLKSMAISNLSLKIKLLDLLPGFGISKFTETKLLVSNIYQKHLSERIVDYLFDKFIQEQEDTTYLQLILQFNPPVTILQRYTKGQELLCQFLSISEGFTYLFTFDYVDINFSQWLHDKKTMKILQFYESNVNKLLFPYFNLIEPVEYRFFLKSLLDTREGLVFFQNYCIETGFVDQLLRDIENGLQNLDNLPELKQDLWILGEITSSNFGIQLIPFEFLEKLIQLFDTCENWVIKNLIFYQIDNLALTDEGIELLDEHKWVVQYNRFNKFENFGFPRKLDLNFFGNEFKLVNFHKSDKVQFHTPDDLTEDEQIILELIFKFPSNLTKLDKQPTKELMYLKKNYPSIFNYELFMKMIKFIDNSNFNFKKRDFVFLLFVDDTNLLETLVKKKKETTKYI